jgi:hypothetical protein
VFGAVPKSNHLMQFLSVTIEDLQVRAKFSPFGVPTEIAFKSLNEAKQAMLHVALAVQALHLTGLVHNDIRWPNVVRTVSGEFMLVDYDLMAILEKGKVPAISNLAKESHPDQVCERHGVGVDYWGLGFLMATCPLDSPHNEFVLKGKDIQDTAFTSDFTLDSLLKYLSSS